MATFAECAYRLRDNAEFERQLEVGGIRRWVVANNLQKPAAVSREPWARHYSRSGRGRKKRGFGRAVFIFGAH